MSRRARLTVSLAVLLCCLGFTAASAAAEEVELRGVVSGQSVGQPNAPLSGATVQLADPETGAITRTTQTNVNGGYVIAAEAGVYDVRVTPPLGSSFDPAVYRGIDLGQTRNLDVVLVPSGTYRLTTVVRDNAGDPIEGAHVTLGNGAVTSTDANGRVVHTVAAGASYWIQAKNDPDRGRRPNTPGSWLARSAPFVVNGDTQRTLTLPRTVRVKVRMQDPGGAPVAGTVSGQATTNTPMFDGGLATEYAESRDGARTDSDGYADTIHFVSDRGITDGNGWGYPSGDGYSPAKFTTPPLTEDRTVLLQFQPPRPADGTPPTISFSQAESGANGWWTSAPATTQVTGADAAIATLACERDGEPVAFDPAAGSGTLTAGVSTSDEGRHSVRCTATDASGNSTSGADTILVDLTPPVIPAATADRAPEHADAAGDWFRDTVTVSFSNRGDPKLADGTPGSGIDPGSLSAPVTRTTSGIVRGSVADNAGNRSNEAVLAVAVDAAAPTVAASCPSAPIILGTAATASVTASDAESGLASDPSGTSPLNTSTVGTQQFTSAPARDRVGHVVSATCSYRVVYDWAGFTGVSNPPAVNATKAGQVEKLNFTLGAYTALDILAIGSPVSQQIDCVTGAPIGTETPVGGSGQLTYQGGPKRYLYSWTTGASWEGTCRQLMLRLADGTEHRASFEFKNKKAK